MRRRLLGLLLALMLLVPANLLLLGGPALGVIPLGADPIEVGADCEVNAPEGVDTDVSVDVEDEDNDNDPEVDADARADVIEDEENENVLECEE